LDTGVIPQKIHRHFYLPPANRDGPDLSPFLSLSEILIPAGNISTKSSGAHNHLLPAFSADGWNFSGGTVPNSGSHTHDLNPRFDVIATFSYTAVPEPTSLAISFIGAGLLGGFVRRRRS
jgi:hypothetical protein